MSAPKHILMVGILACIWNAGGVYDFLAINLGIEAYLNQMSAEQRAFSTGFSLFMTIVWGIATIGSLVGSFLLILKHKWAEYFFISSLLAVIYVTIRNFFFADAQELMMDTQHLIFGIVIIIATGLLYWYSRAMRKQNYLT